MSVVKRNEEVVLGDGHVYTIVATGQKLTSLSKAFSQLVKPEFEREAISYMMARKEKRFELDPNWAKGSPEPTEEEIQERKAEILLRWDTKRDDAAEYGTGLHQIAEKVLLGEDVPKEYEKFKNDLLYFFRHYKEVLPELVLHSIPDGIAGTADVPAIRQNTQASLVDIGDFKTNTEKGIYYDSMRLDKLEKPDHSRRMYKAPFDYLEDCNYNEYAMKTSIYALLFERQYNMKIGKLFLLFLTDLLPEDNLSTKIIDINYIPIPYMKLEAEKFLELCNYHFAVGKVPDTAEVEANIDLDNF